MEFKIPDFLKDSSVDDIHERMLSNLPDDLDKSEGGFLWDFTRVTALEKAEMMEYVIPQILMLIWPQFATGEYLDYHGDTRNITRQPAKHARGFLEVNAPKDTKIPQGAIFSTESKNGVASVDYMVEKEWIVGEEGVALIPIAAVQAGSLGNSASQTITMNTGKVDGIVGVRNPEKIEGGFDEEGDEGYRETILEYDRSMNESFVGSEMDYKRWAESVEDAGKARVLPAQDETGKVTIVMTGRNGEPASEELIEKVTNLIMSPDDREKRLAPPNAKVYVIPSVISPILVTAVVELRSGSMEEAKNGFVDVIRKYLPYAINEGRIKYTKIASILEGLPNIYDYGDLKVNGGTGNVKLDEHATPSISIEGVTFTQAGDANGEMEDDAKEEGGGANSD